jgi:methylated-DNA-[protein]-cysteine S-methyltransferase
MDPFTARLAAPGFSVGVCCDAEAVIALCFLEPGPEVAPDARQNPLAVEAVRQLKTWLLDARFVFDLPTRTQGTPFQKRVWAQIRTIPLGETRTYGEIAQALQNAPRAVGGACGANPLPILVPCHRVIASDGGLGGFARMRGGFLLDTKRWLLQHETGLQKP